MADDDFPYKVGDRVRFTFIGTERVGIIRGFRWQDDYDRPLVVLDIDPPLRGSMGGSMGIHVEQRQIVDRA
jgi:hypothetical protein